MNTIYSSDEIVRKLVKDGFIHTHSTGSKTHAAGDSESDFVFEPVLTASASDIRFWPLECRRRMLVQVPSKTVLLQVTEEHMAGAGILKGDWVVVQRASRGNQRKIVAAIVRNRLCLGLVGNSGELLRFDGVTREGRAAATLERRPFRIFGMVLASYRTY